MRRLIALLSLVFISIFIFTGCSTAHLTPDTPSIPQQAQLDLDRSVALVTDFGTQDSHHLFCSGTWVGARTILTAAHCVKGYINMRHRTAVIKALIENGVPPQIALILSGIDVDNIDLNDPDLTPNAIAMIQLVKQIPYDSATGLDLPYIVPSQVRNVGAAPSSFQHTQVYYMDETTDLALLQTVGYVPSHGTVKIAVQSPKVGETVTMVGSIEGAYFSFRQNYVSAYRHTEKYDGMDSVNGPFMQLAGSLIGHGDSGSGVFNTQGLLVGMVSFVGSDSNLTYCIHLETIRQLLIGQRLEKGVIDVVTPHALDLDDDNLPSLNLQ